MRNLKRTLSLLLAAAMLIGMMVVGASAANSVYDNFSDKDEIVNKDAVNLLTILEIMIGTEDGAQFEPSRPVDRAMMAKMIAVVLNKGQDNSALYVGMDSKLSDVKGTWAEGFINFCVAQGIIAGRGDGRFDPTATVTASEAAKMLLVAAGYDADKEGYVGSDWAINVHAKAAALGIFDGYTGGVLDELSRDDAALLIYNTLDIEMIQGYSATGYAVPFDDHRTILSAMYGIYKLSGVVVGNQWATLNKDASTFEDGVDEALAEGKTRLDDIFVYQSNTLGTNNGITANINGGVLIDGTSYTNKVFDVETPEDYLGERVIMYVRKTTILNELEVVGDAVYYKEGLNTYDGKVGTGTEVYVNYGYCGVKETDAAGHLGATVDKDSLKNINGIEVKKIDNDGDGILDYVLYKKEDLAVVSSVTEGKNGAMGLELYNVDSKDIDVLTDRNTYKPLDLALDADDVILTITYGGRTYVSEPEILVGQMTAYNNDKTQQQTIEIDDDKRSASNIGRLDEYNTSANEVNDILDFVIEDCGDDAGVKFNTTYEFFMDTKGNVRAYRPTDPAQRNYALILDSGYDPGVFDTDATGKVKVLLNNGIEGTYTLDFTASARNLATQLGHDQTGNNVDAAGLTKEESGVAELKGFLGANYSDNSGTRPWQHLPASTAAQSYYFAYRINGNQGDVLDAKNYPHGLAAGYVIKYSLNDNDVMTIEAIIGGVENGKVDGTNRSVLVPNGNWNNYLLSDVQLNVTDKIFPTLHTVGDQVRIAYNGEATLYGKDDARNSGTSTAIDRNTIAFYYNVDDNGKVTYGVRTGYQNMDSVAVDENFVASTIVKTTITLDAQNKKTIVYKDTGLADVVLFGSELKGATARDYAYVISANQATSTYYNVNVILETGEAAVFKVKTSDYNTWLNTYGKNNVFETVWAYVEQDGYYVLQAGEAVVANGQRLYAGAVAINGWEADGVSRLATSYPYYSYNPTTIKIWNISSAKAGTDASSVSDFSQTKEWKVFLIPSGSVQGNEIRSAFIAEKAFTIVTPPPANVCPDDLVNGKHTWDWYGANALDADYKITNTAAQVEEYLSAGYDVRVIGNLILDRGITIPAGQLLRVEGTLDARNYNITGDGQLMVDGDLNNCRNTLAVAQVIVTGTWNLAVDTTVNSAEIYVGQINANSYNLTVGAKTDMHVGYNKDNNSTDDLTGDTITTGTNGHGDIYNAGTITNNGHLDVADDGKADVINTSSSWTLIVGGNLTADELVTRTSARVEIAGKTTVDTLTINNGGNITLGEVVINNNGSVTMGDATVTLTGEFNASATGVEAELNGTQLVLAPINNQSALEVKLPATEDLTVTGTVTLTVSNNKLGDGEEVNIAVTSGNNSLLTWTGDPNEEVSSGTDVSDVVFVWDANATIDADEETPTGAFVVDQDASSDATVELATLNVTLESNDYATANDTGVMTITFKDGATGKNATLKISTDVDTVKYRVGEETVTLANDARTITLTQGDGSEDVTIVITASDSTEGKQTVTKTVKVVGGSVASSAGDAEA